tara:strand:+ start:219 stop:347 length:129 start_codon:yes stop_codon:yes gene_type:complete
LFVELVKKLEFVFVEVERFDVDFKLFVSEKTNLLIISSFNKF